MKAKKILATVLALMMVISMLPVNALAATPGNTTSNRLKVELSASTTFGTTYDPDTPDDETDDIVVSTIAEYNELNDNNGPEDIGGAVLSASNVSTVGDSNIKLADQPFNGKLPDGFSGFSAGDTIYVGVKLRSENMDAAYHGIVAGMVLLKYDPTKLELLATNTDGIARNLAMIGFFNTSTKKADRQGAKAYYCNASISDDSVFGAPGAGSDTGSNIINVSYSFPSDNNGRFPLLEKNTWDVVIPFKVKTGVKSGSSAIEVVKSASYNPGSGDTTAATYLESTDIAVDGDTKIVGSASNMNITAANNPENCTLGKLTVDFTSSDPSASIPANSSIKDVAGQSLTVTLKNCDFNSGAAATATNFSVIPAAGGSAITGAVTASKAGTGTKEAVLTIDGSKLTAGTDAYKITVANTAVTGSPASALETGTFSVTAAPKPLTASFNYGTNELSVTESVAWAWKLKSEAATAYHNVNSGAKATLTEANLTAIRTAMGNNNTLADAIQVIAQSDTAKEAVKNVSITKEPTPTAPASALNLDFTSATPTVTAQSGYEVKDGNTYKTTAVNTTLGGTVTYRKAKGASSIASADATYKVPTAGTLTGITNTTTRDKKLLGQTTVGGVQATDAIKVGTGTASAAGGTTKDVAAEEGATITVTRPGTSGAAGTAQPSKTGTTTGVGFKKPTTLTATKPSSTSADLKLTIPSGKGKFNSNAVVTVKADGSAVTGLTATLSDGTATDATLKGDDVITIAAPSGGWTEDKEYTVEVETNGTTPNLSAKFTTTFTVASAAGYTLKPSVETLTLTPDQFKATADGGAKTEVTIGNIPAGKQVNAVSVPAGKGTVEFTKGDAKFNYTPPATRPTNPEDITVTITLGDIEYDALTYEETSVGHGSAISVAPKTKDARITDLKLNSVAPADKQGEFAVAANGTITVTTPDNLTPNTTYTVTVGSTSIATYTGTATIKVGKAGATVTVANKFYDGTNAVPAEKITVTADKGGATLDITITGATYDNANVGSGKAVSITAATISGTDAANYTVNTSGITGEIERLTGAQVKAETTTAAQVGSIADIVAAVKKQTVTIDGVTADLGTVADIASDTDIETAVKAALDASGSAAVIAPGDQIEANVVEANASKASAAPIAVEQYAGGKITLTGIPEGATAAIKSGNATLTDGVLTGLTSGTVVVTVTPETGDPYDVEIAVTAKADPTENVYDFTKLDATTLNITVSNITGDITTNTDATEITVTLPITKKSSSSGGGYVPSTGYTVAIENTGYGSVDTTAITTDEDGKIVSLPTVTNVKKGVSFVGWSTNGQISGVIDPNTFRVQNDELTLTAVYQGYMAGYEDSTARPNKQITRAELLKMLIVATGDYDATKNYGTSTFTDVKNAWYVNYIACAQQSGKDIIAGYGDGTFKPNAPVTRNEAARMICQAFGVTVSEGDTTNKVNDFSKVAGWAQKYVAALCNNGTIHGYEDGEFKGDRAVTRGESAVMINGYLGLTDAAKEQLRNDPALKNIFKDMTDKQAWNFIDVLFAAMCAPASYYSDEITMPQA